MTDELKPASDEERHVGFLSYTLMILSMTITTSVFFIGWICFTLGLSLYQTLASALIGNVVVAVVMFLNGYPGLKHGITFPFQLRYTFGRKGSVIPLSIRMMISLFWYGIDGYIAAWAITEMILTIAGFAPEAVISQAHVYAPFVFVAYLAFVCVIGSAEKLRGVKMLDTLAGPLLLAFFTFYIVYLLMSFPSPSLQSSGARWLSGEFLTAIAVQTAWWATIATNVSDICRFNKGKERPFRSLFMPHILGLVIPQILGTALGWLAISVTNSAYSPIDVIVYYSPSFVVALFGLIFAALATASTNLTGDIPAVGNGISNFFGISWRKSIIISTVIAFFVGPWWALSESLDMANYLTEFTTAYGSWLGPIAAVMIADYWVVKRRRMDVEELYRPLGAYESTSVKALISLFIGISVEYIIGMATGTLRWYLIPFPGTDLSWYYGFITAFAAHVLISRK
jgi:NCS1 family nucleobase:cation symporter-1